MTRRHREGMVPRDGEMPAQNPPLLDSGTLAQLRDLERRSGRPLVADLVSSYMASAAEAMGHLSGAVASEDLEAVISVAHRLAGSSRAVGAELMGQALTALQGAAGSGDRDSVQNAFARAVATMALTRTALEAELAPTD